MPEIRRYILLGLLAISSWLFANAQEMTEDEQYNVQFQMEMRTQLDKLTSELKRLANDTKKQTVISDRDLRSAYNVRTMDAKAQSLDRRMQALNVRWDAFNASYLSFIVENDTLMERMTQAQLLKQALTDTIEVHRTRCQAIIDFNEAEHIILMQDTIYKKMYKQAFRLSFIQKMEPQLEKLKAQEQALFMNIQEAYDKAKTASETVPQLKSRANKLNERFYALKAQSDKIQQMKYIPLMQRFKDYLMGIACIAIIFIFINMFVTKWQSAKKLKEAAQKQAEMFNKEHEYPTI